MAQLAPEGYLPGVQIGYLLFWGSVLQEEWQAQAHAGS